MNKEEILEIYKSKNIITNNNKRKFCWKQYFDKEAETIFNEYKVNYRTTAEAWWCLLKNVEPSTCEICGNLAKFTGTNKTKVLGYLTVCENCNANQCKDKMEKYHNTISKRSEEDKKEILKKRKETNKILYGDPNYNLFGSESFKNNMLYKYGDKNYNNKEKAKQTYYEKTGYTSNFKNPECIQEYNRIKKEKYGNVCNYEKTKQTYLKKYGYEYIGQIKEFQEKSRQTKHLKIEQIEKNNNCTLSKTLTKKYGQGWKILKLDKIKIENYTFISNDDIPKIEKYVQEGTHTNNYTSNKEKDLLKFIKDNYNGKVIENSTNIVKNNNFRYYELDIYLPEIKVAFEFNGTYWHSDKFKDKYYHQRKLKNCYSCGIQLIHIYEYKWNENIKNKIIQFLNNPNDVLDNWVPLEKYNNYELSEPNEIKVGNLTIYDEGTFVPKYI